MAKFLRLKIRGIRSIGDDEKNAHCFEFLTPCTLISGPNGTGKTTTIEALNYITTGALPTGKLPTFVHNIMVSEKSRIDASVALEFVDVKQRVCTAVRRMTAFVDKSALKTKSEEFTLTVKYKDGTTNSISSKVCDFERAMLQHLGVPKAIFNHVIFCHQEDSTWPLSEPRMLKTKFDQIFQLTKFVQSQARMNTMKKQFVIDKATQEEKKLRYADLVRAKIEAKQIATVCTNKKEKGVSRLETLAEFKKTKIEQKAEIEKKITHIEKSLRDLERLEVEYRNLQQHIQLLRVEPFAGTLQQLEEEINELKMESGNVDFENQRLSISNKIKMISCEVEEISKMKSRLEGEISDLKAQSMRYDDIAKELTNCENDLRDELNLHNCEISDAKIRAAMRAKNYEIEEKLKTSTSDHDDIQSQVDEAQKNLTTANIGVSSCEADIKELQGTVMTLKRKMKSIEESAKIIEELSQKKDEVERQLKKLPDVDENTMSSLIRQREKEQRKLDELSKKCGNAMQFADTEKEILGKTKELEDAQEKLARLTSKHENNWDELYGDAERPTAPWTRSVNEACSEIRSGLEGVESLLKKSQLNAQRIETMQQQLEKEEDKLMKRIDELKNEIENECGCAPKDVCINLAEVRQKLRLARKELAPIDAKIVLYDSWIEETEQKSCCPLCERKFTSKSAVSTFSEKLHDISINFPNEREHLEKEVIRCEELEKKLAKGEMNVAELRKIEIDVEDVRSKGNTNLLELEKIREDVEEKMQGKAEFEKNLGFIMAIQADVGVMDSLYERCVSLERTVQELKSSLPVKKGSESYAELKRQLSEQEEIYRRVVKEGDEMQKLAAQRNNLQAEFNRLREERVALGESATQAANYRDQLSETENNLEACQRKYQQLLKDVPVLRKKLEMATAERRQRSDERRQAEASLMLKMNELKNKCKKYDDLNSKVSQLTHSENQLNEKERDLNMANVRLAENQKRKIALEMEMNNLNGSHSKLRDLEDQLSRMKIEEKMRTIMDDVNTLKRLGADKQEVRKMRTELETIQNELIKANQDEIRIHAILEENEARLKQAEEKLKNVEISNAEELYRNVILELAILKEAILDLERYMTCLDHSLLRFHTENMALVNDIIDEMWRKVYNSTDITTIKIRSEMNSGKNKNRAYDYKVVMVLEGGFETEMRGRCSAGQKMLASLIIRIALAEVFGGMCSMIALDEPTTNLDDTKVEGMADILSSLIESRKIRNSNGAVKERDMQMIVITHDDRLVNKLTLSCRPDYIYLLGKNEHGISYLTKRFPDGREMLMSSRK